MEGGDINKCPYYAAKMGKTSFEGHTFLKNIYTRKILCLLHICHLLHLLLSTAVSGNPTHACQLAMMLLRHPHCQVALAAILVAFTAWYLM